MRIEVDRSSVTPPFAQVRDTIVRLIERGKLGPGTRLPTVRAMADSLGVVPNTVARAYRELAASGYVVGLGRAGTFVSDRLPEPPAAGQAKLRVAADAYARRGRQLGFDASDIRRALARALGDS